MFRLNGPKAVAILVTAWVVYVGRFWLAAPPLVASFDDGAQWVSAALHLGDPTLFARDWAFQAWAPVAESLLYTRALALLLPWWETPEALFRVLSALLIGLFAVGVFVLVRDLTERVPVALLAGLVALRPRMALFAEWGILMSHPLARSVVMAAAPWVLLWIWRARRQPIRLCGPGIVIGLLALIHPLSALLLALVAGLQELLMPGGLRGAVCLGAGVVVGGLPALWSHGALIADTPVPTWLIRFRNPEGLPGGIRTYAGPLVYDFGVPLLLLALALRASRASLAPVAYRWLCAGLAAALGLGVATALAPSFPTLAKLSLGRATGYAYLFLSVPILVVAWVWWAAGPRRLAAVGLAAGLALSTGAWWDTLLDRAIAAAGIPLGGRQAWNPSRLPEPLPSPPSLRPEQDPPAFRELARWIRSTTNPDALFLTPPSDSAALRVYARRGIVVSVKDAGFFNFSATRAAAWYARFRDVTVAYASGDPAALVAVARRYGATHILAGPGQPPLPQPPAFVNRTFVVYALEPEP